MDLVQVAKFSTLAEAQVACAALHAADIPAYVPDEHLGAVAWTYQLALGNFRVLVPDDLLDAAKAELRTLETPAAPSPPIKQSLLVLVLCVLAVAAVAALHVALVPVVAVAAIAILHHSRKRARREALGD